MKWEKNSLRNSIRENTISAELTQDEIRETLLNKITEEKIDQKPSEDDMALVKQIRQVKPGQRKVVSLFSGAGGLDLGVEIAGLRATVGELDMGDVYGEGKLYAQLRDSSLFQTVYANDAFKEALMTHRLNFDPDVLHSAKDIRKVTVFPESDIVLGGFPCPGYSLGGPRLIDDKRNFLYIHFIRVLTQTQPDFFIAENVKGLLSLGKGEVLKQVVEDFSAAGYTVTAHLVNAKDYGVPQSRERVFLIGVHKEKIEKRYGFSYSLPEASHSDVHNDRPNLVTLDNAIKDLKDDPGYVHEGGYSSIYMSRNRKKSWDEQSFTIQASGRQAPQHPGGKPMKKLEKDVWVFQGNLNRRLSVKEIARIQTFPDWFKFVPSGDGLTNNEIDKLYKQIGNAVPVRLAAAIAEPIARFYTDLA